MLDWQAVKLSLELAFCSSFILLVIGLPLAYWLSKSKRKWKFLIEAAVALPIILPPTVLGFYILYFTGPHGTFGKALESLGVHALPFTFMGILFGSVLYNLPFAVRPFIAGFSSVDTRLVEASKSLGVSNLGTFFRTEIPLAWGGILTGFILSFAHTIGEFGVVLMVGGSIPGVTRTLSISIYDDVQSLNYAAANVSACVLLVFAYLILSGLSLLQKKGLPI